MRCQFLHRRLHADAFCPSRDLPDSSPKPIQGLRRNDALDLWTSRKAESEELPLLRSCHRTPGCVRFVAARWSWSRGSRRNKLPIGPLDYRAMLTLRSAPSLVKQMRASSRPWEVCLRVGKVVLLASRPVRQWNQHRRTITLPAPFYPPLSGSAPQSHPRPSRTLGPSAIAAASAANASGFVLTAQSGVTRRSVSPRS